MNRRTLLAGTGIGIGVAAGGYSFLSTDLSTPSWLDSLKWSDSNNLIITFESDHEIDGVGFGHRDHNSTDEYFHSRETPEFSGPIEVNLASQIEQHGGPFPDRTFKLVGYIGHISERGVSIINDTKGEYEFDVPESVVGDGYFD